MTTYNPLYPIEWDHSSYVRKFHQTIAYTVLGDGLPSWRWIAAISDNYLVYDNTRKQAIGQIVLGASKGEAVHDTEKYPVVQFLYQPIWPGAYLGSDGELYYLIRRHLKSYKIGLSDETFMIYKGDHKDVYVVRVSNDIKLDKPINSYIFGGMFEVFSHKVVRLGTRLFADGDSIGFMEQGVCVLRHQNFKPLIKPLLGDAWQIEN